MTVKIDENTGLPELPAGHYWHVRKAAIKDWHHIEIRQGWIFPFSRVREYRIETSMLTEQNLKQSARAVFDDFEFIKARRITAKSLRGSYPPKTLNKQKDTV